MADPILKPIPGMAPAATLTGAELVPVVQGGVNVRATAQEIANLAGAAGGGGVAHVVLAAGQLIWSNQPAALAIFLNTVTNSPEQRNFLLDLSGYTQCRLTVSTGVVGAAAARIILRYGAAYASDASSYLAMATTEVAASIAAVGVSTSGWQDIVSGAKADVIVSLLGDGGDSTADPRVYSVVAEFR